MTKTKKAGTYTPEETLKLGERYIELRGENKTNKEVMTVLEKEFSKSARSIRMKLVSQDIYTKDAAIESEAKAADPSKKELIKTLEEESGLSFGNGLDGASKGSILELIDFVKAKNDESEEQSENTAVAA
jgi:hypothetical protein